MRRRQGRQKRITAWYAVVCSIAFLGASNYCNLEACTAHSTHAHDAQHAATAQPHDEDSSTPAHHHDENSTICCSAMQAIAASTFDFHLASRPAWPFHSPTLQSSWLASLLKPSRTASGLSPPAREPTPANSFYRTTYANHAPPVHLA